MRRRLAWLEVGDGCDSKTWILYVACLNHPLERGHCWLVLEFFGPIFYQNPATLQRLPGARVQAQTAGGIQTNVLLPYMLC